jgi:hypothetical protein
MDDAREGYDLAVRLVAGSATDNRAIACSSLIELVDIRLYQKKLEQAKRDSFQAIAAADEVYAEGSIGRAEAAGSLGRVILSEDSGDIEKARLLLQVWLKARTIHYGATHPLVAEAHHYMALVCRGAHEYHLAFYHHHMSIFLFEKHLGVRNMVSMASVASLGITVQARADHQVSSFDIRHFIALF